MPVGFGARGRAAVRVPEAGERLADGGALLGRGPEVEVVQPGDVVRGRRPAPGGGGDALELGGGDEELLQARPGHGGVAEPDHAEGEGARDPRGSVGGSEEELDRFEAVGSLARDPVRAHHHESRIDAGVGRDPIGERDGVFGAAAEEGADDEGPEGLAFFALLGEVVGHGLDEAATELRVGLACEGLDGAPRVVVAIHEEEAGGLDEEGLFGAHLVWTGGDEPEDAREGPRDEVAPLAADGGAVNEQAAGEGLRWWLT